VSPARQRMVTVLHPLIAASRTPPGWAPLPSDYISVPYINTIGTWRVLNMLGDQSMYTALNTYNTLAKALYFMVLPYPAESFSVKCDSG